MSDENEKPVTDHLGFPYQVGVAPEEPQEAPSDKSETDEKPKRRGRPRKAEDETQADAVDLP